MSSPATIEISEHDPNSYANNRQAKITHVHLNLEVLFASSELKGHVDLNVELLSATNALVLDTSELTISSIHLESAADKPALTYVIGEKNPLFGRALRIDLPAAHGAAGSKLVVRIAYSTAASATALQWLPPAQTKGGKYPYLFSQCQAIHCRSMVPIQDTPSNKFTYSASVVVDAPLVALMSAEQTGHKQLANGKSEFTFHQKVPIPSYLLAIAVGHLEKRKIGPRSHVWSEKEMVEAGAFEFSDTEKYIQAGEAICGPYVWGHYDILLLPPSFPYGGMENPCLTYVTPTLLAGDRSLSNVVAHEIAHSWFGNLVTSETWESFWMNEGFTVFLERKILKSLTDTAHQHLHAQIGLNDLQKSVERFGIEHPYTCLCPHLKGVDPDDAFSSVPYEKGFNFLFYLEGLVGGEEVMNKFLRAHCEKYANKTVNSNDWKVFFLDYMKNVAKVSEATLAQIDWETWFNKPGMPCVSNVFDQSLIKGSQDLAKNIIEGSHAPKVEDIKSWDSAQLVIFLETLLEYQKTYAGKGQAEEFAKKLLTVDSALNFTASKNAEIRFRWLTLCIRQPFEDRFPAVEAFLAEQGRMKYIRPLYRDLFTVSSAAGKEFAVKVFQKHGSMYHSIAQKMVSKDLQLS